MNCLIPRLNVSRNGHLFRLGLQRISYSSGRPSEKYLTHTRTGKLLHDPEQLVLVEQLDKLSARMKKYEPQRELYLTQLETLERQLKEWEQNQQTEASMMNNSSKQELEVESAVNQESVARPIKPERPRVPRGLYLWGDVGTGKTMLLDLFFEETELKQKRRVHFHEFMLEVHERIHKWKSERIATHGRDTNIDLSSEGDAITQVARMIARDSTLLAFDEFVVNNVVDALMMRHLFLELFSRGTVVVATSNTPPEKLYPNGLNRDYFLPFIGVLQGQCKVHRIPSKLDYRVHSASSVSSASTEDCPRFISVAPGEEQMDKESSLVFERVVGKLSESEKVASMQELEVPVMFGRSLTVKHHWDGVAMFSFEDLCGSQKSSLAKYAPDYKALCDNFHTLILTHVPILTKQKADDARRFITLVDQLYDHHRGLFLVTEAQYPTDILDAFKEYEIGTDDSPSNHSTSLIEMQTALKRTGSRLVEMCFGDTYAKK